MLIWGIWNAQNALIFEDSRSTPEQITSRAFSYLHAFQMSSAKTGIAATKPTVVQRKQQAPTNDSYKINVDGAFKEGQEGRARIGAIVRNCKGEIIASLASPVRYACNPIFLEAMAILKGLLLAQELGVAGYQVECDWLQLVDRIRMDGEDLSEVGHVVQEIRKVIKLLSCTSISQQKDL